MIFPPEAQNLEHLVYHKIFFLAIAGRAITSTLIDAFALRQKPIPPTPFTMLPYRMRRDRIVKGEKTFFGVVFTPPGGVKNNPFFLFLALMRGLGYRWNIREKG